MPQIQRNSGLTANDLVTNAKLHNLVDTAVITKELITSQTAMSEVEGGAFLLTYSTASDALRKITFSNILSDLSYDNMTIGLLNGTTEMRGVFNFYTADGATPPSASTHSYVKIDQTNVGVLPYVMDIKGGINITNSDEAGGILPTDTSLLTSRIILGNRIELKDNNHDTPVGDWGEKYTLNLGFDQGGGPDGLKVIFDTNSKTEFKGQLRLIDGIIYIGEEKADPADEVTVDLSATAKGVYDISIVNVNKATWSTALGDIRRSYADVPVLGKILLDQQFTIPANEKWIFEYDGFLADGTDDPMSLVWQIFENNVSTTHETINYDHGPRTGEYCGTYIQIDGGTTGRTLNIRLRGAVVSGSGGDSFDVFGNYIASNGYYNWQRKRKITKIRY